MNSANDSDADPVPPGPRWKQLFNHRSVLVIVGLCFLAVILVVRHIQHSQQDPGDALRRGPGRPGGPGGAAGPGHTMPVAVAVATVQPGDIQIRIPALGTVVPLASVTVRTQIAGQLQKIAFTEGQFVHQGDFIAQIDPRPYEAALQQMRANMRRDEALLADARLDLKRYEGLIKEDAIAQQQLDTQRALVDQYEGTVASDAAQINTAQLNLQYTHIVSPVTGRVGLRQVDQGNYVTPTDTNGLVLINQLQPITVLFPIPEDYISAIMRRLHEGATLTVEAFDRTNSTKLADGKLLTVDNSIDTTTGTVKLRALFDNRDGLLFPNQFVNVELLQDVLRNQLIMPNAAVHRGAPNGVATTFVYLVTRNTGTSGETGSGRKSGGSGSANAANGTGPFRKSDATVSVRPVTLGVVDGERVAVTAGLKAGDVVVTEGGDRLRDGAAVELPSAAPPAPAAARTPGGASPRKRPANAP